MKLSTKANTALPFGSDTNFLYQNVTSNSSHLSTLLIIGQNS
ncbi:hypothetical protein MNBD_ALPHA11-1757 [hydrothermal vent metagenome]|uniref:Uncharacterized protein n=1 Tax=hydrothermal vent metagenome TaxID=652676 RepID=A0A3B0TPR4_9ZZZZ